jgi:hypothetical protein
MQAKITDDDSLILKKNQHSNSILLALNLSKKVENI